MRQEDLAKTAKLHQTTISRVEMGLDGSSDELRMAIAKALQCSPATLFAWPTDEPKPKAKRPPNKRPKPAPATEVSDPERASA